MRTSAHSLDVDEPNFIKCSEIVYSEFIEIICNTTLCQTTQYLFIRLLNFRIFTDAFQYLQWCCMLWSVTAWTLAKNNGWAKGFVLKASLLLKQVKFWFTDILHMRKNLYWLKPTRATGLVLYQNVCTLTSRSTF